MSLLDSHEAQLGTAGVDEIAMAFSPRKTEKPKRAPLGRVRSSVVRIGDLNSQFLQRGGKPPRKTTKPSSKP